MWGPIMGTAEKAAGRELGVAVDNLEPGAWQQEALVESAAQYHELFARGYILDGTAGLTHTQAQTYWAQGKAVFIPCGAWLENELGAIAPKDLEMTAKPAPGLGAGDALPFVACNGGPGGDLIVAADSPNPGGGMEVLRAMLSVEATRRRTEVTRSLGIVRGATVGADVSVAMASMSSMIDAAGDNVGSVLDVRHLVSGAAEGGRQRDRGAAHRRRRRGRLGGSDPEEGGRDRGRLVGDQIPARGQVITHRRARG